MTAASQHIIDDFEALPDAEKREVLATLVRLVDYPPAGDDELVSAANETFLQYDRREEDQ